MTKKEYLQRLAAIKVNSKKVKKVETSYGTELPEIIRKIVTSADETIFFDDGFRILSLDEICDAEKDLHVNFKEKGIIPLADCGENDFIVYHFEDEIWSKFNIIDETVFKKKSGFEELLK